MQYMQLREHTLYGSTSAITRRNLPAREVMQVGATIISYKIIMSVKKRRSHKRKNIFYFGVQLHGKKNLNIRQHYN